MMVHFGKFIAKHRSLIFLLSLLLLIPSALGYIATRINYDVLSYLPDTLETVAGQDILVDEFGMGAFSMVIVENMEHQDVVRLEETIEGIDHVKDVLWYDDILDISVPEMMLPSDLKDALFTENSTMMIALFDQTTSADETMDAISTMRAEVGKECFISGMSGIVTDIKNLALKEMPVYVLIASLLSVLVLMLTLESAFVPVLFLTSIGMAVIFNLGSNIFLGQISYITQALTAVLQLGVTMDYSIFLLSSYEELKPSYEHREDAMAEAISRTFTSVAGGSTTTIAGFAALLFMTFTLGRDLGIVMIKGVFMGVFCCITVLPAMILLFEKAIQKTTHKPIIPALTGLSDFLTRFNKLWLLLFLVLLLPAKYGNDHVDLYYNLDSGLPKDLDSSIANAKLSEEYEMSSVYMLMFDSRIDAMDKGEMIEQIKETDGVKWALGLSSILGSSFPESFIPADLLDIFQSGELELAFVCSDYATATDPANAQIASINQILKSYDEQAMIIGEAPLMKDLQDVTDVDLQTVNTISMAAIFLIIMFVFKSISLPVILVLVIEFAIFVNMAIPYYQGTPLPFVASIVIGTIQLGATIDYAILMTNRYVAERAGKASKKDAVRIAHRASTKPIITSGLSFFAATFGVGLYSSIDMISAITNLLSRGAIISTIVVLGLLPAMFMVFDPVICRTTGELRKKKVWKEDERD